MYTLQQLQYISSVRIYLLISSLGTQVFFVAVSEQLTIDFDTF